MVIFVCSFEVSGVVGTQDIKKSIVGELTQTNISAEIIMPKIAFTGQDNLYFDYTITSVVDTVVSYDVGIYCDRYLQIPFRSEFKVDLKANIPYKSRYDYGIIEQLNEEVIPYDGCVASLQVLEPEFVLVQEVFGLSAENRIVFDLLVCKDKLCEKPYSIFNLNEEVFLSYRTNSPNIKFDSSLKYPDKTNKISLPYSFRPSKIGTYSLIVNYKDKSGKNIEKKSEFYVSSGKLTLKNRFSGISRISGKVVSIENDNMNILDLIKRWFYGN